MRPSWNASSMPELTEQTEQKSNSPSLMTDGRSDAGNRGLGTKGAGMSVSACDSLMVPMMVPLREGRIDKRTGTTNLHVRTYTQMGPLMGAAFE